MSAKLINIALDLETLSTQEDAAIIQIGCCIPYFDRVNVPLGLSCEFETTIRYEDCISSEFHKSHATMDWWDKQNPKARNNVFSGQNSYTDAFDQFKFWIDSIRSNGAEVAIWGNGSDFDNRLLSYSLDSLGYHNVWSFRNNRDLRTLKALFPLDVADDPTEVKHTALGDARYEARIINAIHSTYIWASAL
jgi:3' exoribonuclease, RNase T-like